MYDNHTPEPVKGMSTGAKIGIGCGGCLGVVALGGAALMVVAVIATSTGDSGSEVATGTTPAPSPSATRTEEEVTPVKEDEPAEELDVDPTSLLRIVLTSGWNEMDASEQSDVCLGWSISSDMMTDAFIEGFGTQSEEHITEDQVRETVTEFYNEKCE